jgi:PAS domain S-box-containing protein
VEFDGHEGGLDNFSMNMRVPMQGDIKTRLGAYIDSFAQVFNLFSDLVIVTDDNANILFANGALSRVTGFEWKDVSGHNPADLWGGLLTQEQSERMWNRVKIEKKTYISMIRSKRKDSSLYWQELHIYPVLDDSGQVTMFIGFSLDITPRMMEEAEMKKRSAEVEVMNKYMVGRELKMEELKKEIVDLQKQLEELIAQQGVKE